MTVVKLVFDIDTRVSKDRCTALGEICVHFALLENTMDRAIWAFLNLDRKAGRKVTLRMMTLRRINLLRLEAKFRFGELSDGGKRFKKVIDFIGEIADARNIYVHGLWGKGRVKGSRRKHYVLSYFKRSGGEHLEAKAGEMRHLVQAIDVAIDRLTGACHQYLGVPLP